MRVDPTAVEQFKKEEELKKTGWGFTRIFNFLNPGKEKKINVAEIEPVNLEQSKVIEKFNGDIVATRVISPGYKDADNIKNDENEVDDLEIQDIKFDPTDEERQLLMEAQVAENNFVFFSRDKEGVLHLLFNKNKSNFCKEVRDFLNTNGLHPPFLRVYKLIDLDFSEKTQEEISGNNMGLGKR